MRKFIYIVLNIIILYGCQNYIDVPNPDTDPKLLVNADLNCADSEHIIYVAANRMGETQGLSDAHLKCILNGKDLSVEKMSVSDEEYEDYKIHGFPYRFFGKMEPGDELRIEVVSGGMKAYCELKAPETAEILSADMKPRSVITTDDIKKSYYDFSLKLRDIKGAGSWYRLRAEFVIDVEVIYKNTDGVIVHGPLRSIFTDRESVISYDDPILNDGYSGDELDFDSLESFIASIMPKMNVCKIFSDKYFCDSEAELHFSTEENPNLDFYYLLPEMWNSSASSATVEGSAYVQLYVDTLPYESYAHYRALNSAENIGYSDVFLSEPTIFPSNIVGGLGFVSISSPVSKLIKVATIDKEIFSIIYT